MLEPIKLNSIRLTKHVSLFGLHGEYFTTAQGDITLHPNGLVEIHNNGQSTYVSPSLWMHADTAPLGAPMRFDTSTANAAITEQPKHFDTNRELVESHAEVPSVSRGRGRPRKVV